VSAVAAQDIDVRHGYTVADVQRLARVAILARARSLRPTVATYPQIHGEACGLIVIYLYEQADRPAEVELLRAVDRGFSAATEKDLSFRGRPRSGDYGTAPRFAKYWMDFATSMSASPEDRVVDHIAVRQILAHLSPARREPIIVMAATGDRDLAAEALGITRSQFTTRLTKARAAFRALWHEGEMPSAAWSYDRGSRDDGVMAAFRDRRRRIANRRDQNAAPEVGAS